MAFATVHHWQDPIAGLREMRRVSRRVVVFTHDTSDTGWRGLIRMTVRSSRCVRRLAAMTPAYPPPITTTSVFSVMVSPSFQAVRAQDTAVVTVLRARSYKTVAFPVLYLAPVLATPALELTA
jgi:hypothetical protein